MSTSLEASLVQVEENADRQWKDVARDCLRWLNQHRQWWTTDDFWDAMKEHYPDITTHEVRALGPLILAMIRAGDVEKTPGRTTVSRRPEAHKAVLFIYRKPIDAGLLRIEQITQLARMIRHYDGNHDKGAGALAELLIDAGVRVPTANAR